MVDVKNKYCEMGDCLKRPSFNYEGKNRSIYCAKHKEEDMVNVQNKKCVKESC